MQINSAFNTDDWIDLYKKLVYWELEIAQSEDQGLRDVLKMQKTEANNSFSKFIKKEYISWFNENELNRPLISPNVFKNKIFPFVENNQPVVVLLIDNLREAMKQAAAELEFERAAKLRDQISNLTKKVNKKKKG